MALEWVSLSDKTPEDGEAVFVMFAELPVYAIFRYAIFRDGAFVAWHPANPVWYTVPTNAQTKWARWPDSLQPP